VAFHKPVAGQGVSKLLYYFQSLDLMGLMFITAGSLRFKFPHMANGANFAFEKKLFEGIGGYSGIDATPTGDDILFLLKAHSHHPGCAGFIKSKAAIVATGAAPTWAAFWQQRLRWVSKSAGFNDARLTAVLAFYYLYALATVAAGIGMFFNLDFFLPFFGLLFGKLLPELVMLAHAAAFFGKLRHLVWFLPSQLLHVYYVLRIGLQSQLKRYDWKGRKYGG
jgi:cellulose synthase/poly-beta-1,6-N-acetylglucosamine synthase-like glycosyltransferase